MNSLSICKTIIQSIKTLLHYREFLDSHRHKNRFIRSSGKLSMYHVIVYLFYTSKQAMNINISNIRMDLPELDFPKVSKQAVSKARQGIVPSLFQDLFTLSVDIFYKSIDKRKRWRDRFHIYAVDGSRISLPNSKSNFENYSEMFSKKNPKRRWSMALCSVIYDVCNDFIVHGLLKNYLGSERHAALQHCKDLESLNLFDNSILIFDRGYYSEDMFRYFSEKGYLCVMRLRDKYKLSRQCTGDNVLVLYGDPKKGTADINVRVISVKLDGGETEYLATSVFDSLLTAEDFRELYFMRWPIEQKYGELKNQFIMEEFSGATSTSIEQEFFINLLLSNLAALIKASADEMIEKKARSTNKFRYQANRAYIIGRLKWFVPRFLSKTSTMLALDDIFEGAVAVRSQIQPGRKDKRNKRNSDRERKHFNNRKRVI